MTTDPAILPWPLVTLADVTENVKSVVPPADGEFTYVDISSIDNDRCEIVGARRMLSSEAPSRARRPIQEGDVLFSNVRTYLRNVAQVGGLQGPAIASTGFTVLRPTDDIDSRYLYHLSRSDFFIDRVTPEQTGTHYPATSDRVVREQKIPLPPRVIQAALAATVDAVEQCRTASAAHLDAASEAIVRFRQALLAAACSGRLTAEWLQRAGASDVDGVPAGWERATVGDLSERVSVGHVGPTSKFYTEVGDGVRFIRSQNVRPGRLVLDGTQFITKEFHDSLRKSQLRAGDVLIVRVGANRADCCLVPLDFDGELNCANIVFARPSKVSPAYLALYLQGPGRSLMLHETTGSAQGVVNTKAVAQIPIAVPPPDEQAEIVRRVDEMYALAAGIEQRSRVAARQVERSSQAVLSKAFRGQLTLSVGST